MPRSQQVPELQPYFSQLQPTSALLVSVRVTIQFVSKMTFQAAQDSNTAFKLENLFNVKDRGTVSNPINHVSILESDILHSCHRNRCRHRHRFNVSPSPRSKRCQSLHRRANRRKTRPSRSAVRKKHRGTDHPPDGRYHRQAIYRQPSQRVLQA